MGRSSLAFSRRAGLDEGAMVLGQILIALKTHNFLPEVQLEGLRASLVLLNPGMLLKSFFFRFTGVHVCGTLFPILLKNKC